MQSRQQAVQRGEAGAAAEDAIKPGTQGERPALAGPGPVSFEIGIEFPDQTTNALLSGAVLVSERVQLMHQSFRVNPAQRVPTDIELAGVITQHDCITQEFVRLNAAP